jgi:hypothetical protein
MADGSAAAVVAPAAAVVAPTRDACRAVYEDFVRKHGANVAHRSADGSTFMPIQPSADESVGFALICTVCREAWQAGIIRPTTWASRGYRGSGNSFQQGPKPTIAVEDLKRHVNASQGQSTGKVGRDHAHDKAMRWKGAQGPERGGREGGLGEGGVGGRGAASAQDGDGAEDSLEFMVPSAVQIRIAVELAHGWAGSALSDYPRRCEAIRREGGDVPCCRCSEEVCQQIVAAASAREYDRDRTSIIPEMLECSWAQDKATNVLAKYRYVASDWSVGVRVIDYFHPTGDRAVQGVVDMAASLDQLCGGEGPVKIAFQDKCKNSNADGAPSEQSCLRLARAKNILPKNDFITRAEEHSAALVPKNATKHCDYIAPLIQQFVAGLSTKGPGGQTKVPGGLARHILNSAKFGRKYERQAKEQSSRAMQAVLRVAQGPDAADAAPRSKGNVHFCMPRFDCWVNPLKDMLANVRVPLGALADDASDPSAHPTWSRDLLDGAFSYKSLVTVCLTTELYDMAKDWVHARDQRKRGTFQSICISKRLNDEFKRDINDLVMKEPPIILSKGYTRGLTNRLLANIQDSLVITAADGHRVLGWPGDWEGRMEPLGHARLLGKWMLKYTDFLFPNASLQHALAPFDLAGWCHTDTEGERDLVGTYFKPIASCRGANLDMALSGYFRIRPLAELYRTQGHYNVPDYWGRALQDRNASVVYKDFATIAQPMSAQWLGNGEIEGSFSIIEGLAWLRRGYGADILRALVKLRLDGPRPDALTSGAGLEWVREVQKKYFELFGGRSTRATEIRRGRTTFLDARAGVKRPHLQSGNAESDRKRKTQFADLQAEGVSANLRENVFGAAPSDEVATQVRNAPEELLQASKSKRTYDTLLPAAADRMNRQLRVDRLPASNAHLRKAEKAADEREATIAKSRQLAAVTTPAIEAAAGRFMKLPQRPDKNPILYLYAPSLAPGSGGRELLKRLRHDVTTQSKVALAPRTLAFAVYVPHLASFLAALPDTFGWQARLLGAGAPSDLSSSRSS